MGRYDFDTVVNRIGSGSVKWDECPGDVIPMWVADMDFKVAPFVIEAMQKRISHGIFGYTLVGDSYYDSIVSWFASRRNWKIERDWIIYVPGVVPAISCTIKALTSPGDKVAFNTPAYNCFFSSIRNMQCEAVACPLRKVEGRFELDFEDIEAKVSDPAVKCFLFCNPHNPSGRIWTREEMQRLYDICSRHDTVIISDEIHCELEMPGHCFVPFASLSDEVQKRVVTFNSPSKAFNIAGIQIANIICSEPEIRKRIDRAVNDAEVCDVNCIGPEALVAAYSREGEEWLRELNGYIWSNYTVLRERFSRELPSLEVTPLEGTYLVWIDCSSLETPTDEIKRVLLEDFKVWINAGGMYGDSDYIRVNIAAPKSIFDEGLDRLVKGLASLK